MVYGAMCASRGVAADGRVSPRRRRGEPIAWRRGGDDLRNKVGVALGGRLDQNFVEVDMVRACRKMTLVVVSRFFGLVIQNVFPANAFLQQSPT